MKKIMNFLFILLIIGVLGYFGYTKIMAQKPMENLYNYYVNDSSYSCSETLSTKICEMTDVKIIEENKITINKKFDQKEKTVQYIIEGQDTEVTEYYNGTYKFDEGIIDFIYDVNDISFMGYYNIKTEIFNFDIGMISDSNYDTFEIYSKYYASSKLASQKLTNYVISQIDQDLEKANKKR